MVKSLKKSQKAKKKNFFTVSDKKERGMTEAKLSIESTSHGNIQFRHKKTGQYSNIKKVAKEQMAHARKKGIQKFPVYEHVFFNKEIKPWDDWQPEISINGYTFKPITLTPIAASVNAGYSNKDYKKEASFDAKVLSQARVQWLEGEISLDQFAPLAHALGLTSATLDEFIQVDGFADIASASVEGIAKFAVSKKGITASVAAELGIMGPNAGITVKSKYSVSVLGFNFELKEASISAGSGIKGKLGTSADFDPSKYKLQFYINVGAFLGFGVEAKVKGATKLDDKLPSRITQKADDILSRGAVYTRDDVESLEKLLAQAQSSEVDHSTFFSGVWGEYWKWAKVSAYQEALADIGYAIGYAAATIESLPKFEKIDEDLPINATENTSVNIPIIPVTSGELECDVPMPVKVLLALGAKGYTRTTTTYPDGQTETVIQFGQLNSAYAPPQNDFSLGKNILSDFSKQEQDDFEKQSLLPDYPIEPEQSGNIVNLNAGLYATSDGKIGGVIGGTILLGGGATLAANVTTEGTGLVALSIPISSTAVVATGGALIGIAAIGLTSYYGHKHLHNKRAAHVPYFLTFDDEINEQLAMGLYNLHKGKGELSNRQRNKFEKKLKEARKIAKTPEQKLSIDFLSDLISKGRFLKSYLENMYANDAYRTIKNDAIIELLKGYDALFIKSATNTIQNVNDHDVVMDIDSKISKNETSNVGFISSDLNRANDKIPEALEDLANIYLNQPEKYDELAATLIPIYSQHEHIDPTSSTAKIEVMLNRISEYHSKNVNTITTILNYFYSKNNAKEAKEFYLKYAKEIHDENNIEHQDQIQNSLENYIFLMVNNTAPNNLPDLADLEKNLKQGLSLPNTAALCAKINNTFNVVISAKIIEDTATFFVNLCRNIQDDFERHTLLGIACTGKVLATLLSTCAHFDKKIFIESEKICRQLQNNNLTDKEKLALKEKLLNIQNIFTDPAFWHAASSIIDTARIFVNAQKNKERDEDDPNVYLDDSELETTLHGASIATESVGTALDMMQMPEWNAWGIAKIIFQLTRLGLGATEFIDKLSGHFFGPNAGLELRQHVFVKKYLYETVRLGSGAFSIAYDWSADALLLNTGFQVASMLAPYIKISQYNIDSSKDLKAIKDTEVEEGKIYVAIKKNKILYKAKNAEGLVVSGRISARELGEKIPSDTKELQALLYNILEVTSKRGHTESYVNSLIRQQTNVNIEASLYPSNEALIKAGKLQPVDETLTLVACIDGVKASAEMVGIAPVAKVITTAAVATGAAVMSLLPAVLLGTGATVIEAVVAETVIGTVAAEAAIGAATAAEVAAGAAVVTEVAAGAAATAEVSALAAAWAKAGVYAAAAAPYFAVILFVGVGGVICYNVYECQYNRTTNNYVINAYIEAERGNLDAAVQNFIETQKRERPLTFAEWFVNGTNLGFVFKETQQSADTKLTNQKEYLEKLNSKEGRNTQKEYYYQFDSLHMELNKKDEEINWQDLEKKINERIDADKEFQGFKRDLAACFFRQAQYDAMLASIRKQGTFFNPEDTYGLLTHGIAQLQVGHTQAGRETLANIKDYQFALKNDLKNNAKPEKGKIYVGTKDGKLEYQVINTRGLSETGMITATQLGKDIPQDESQLEALLPDILAVTSERGHTHDHKNNLERATLELTINNLDQRIIAAEFVQMISDLAYTLFKLPDDNNYNKAKNKLAENKYTAVSSLISLVINSIQSEITKLRAKDTASPSTDTQRSIDLLRDLLLIEKGLRAAAYSGLFSLSKEQVELLDYWSAIFDAHVSPYLEFIRSSMQTALSIKTSLKSLINFSPEVLMKAPIINNYLLHPGQNDFYAGLRFFMGNFLKKLAQNNNAPVLIKNTPLNKPVDIIKGPLEYFLKNNRVFQWFADFFGADTIVDDIYYLMKFNVFYNLFNEVIRAFNIMDAFVATIKNQEEEIIHYLHGCCEHGDVRASYNLGKIYEQGTMVEKNIVQAIKHYQACLDNAYMLASPLERIILNSRASKKLFLIFSSDFSSSDLHKIAVLYRDGQSVNKKEKFSEELFEKYKNKKQIEQRVAVENAALQETSLARRKILIAGLINAGLIAVSVPTMVGPALALFSTASWLICQNRNKANESNVITSYSDDTPDSTMSVSAQLPQEDLKLSNNKSTCSDVIPEEKQKKSVTFAENNTQTDFSALIEIHSSNKTLPNGNCVFNSVALFIRDSFLNLRDNNSILIEFMKILNQEITVVSLNLKNVADFRRWFQNQSSEDSQHFLAPILRQMVIKIMRNPDNNYQAHYLEHLKEMLNYAINNPISYNLPNADTFLVHPFIKKEWPKMVLQYSHDGTQQNTAMETWWNDTGFSQYLDVMETPATSASDISRWGSHVELDILGKLFQFAIYFNCEGQGKQTCGNTKKPHGICYLSLSGNHWSYLGQSKYSPVVKQENSKRKQTIKKSKSGFFKHFKRGFLNDHAKKIKPSKNHDIENTENQGYVTDEEAFIKLNNISRNYREKMRNTYMIDDYVKVEDVDGYDSDDETPIWIKQESSLPGKRILNSGFFGLSKEALFWEMLQENGYKRQNDNSIQLPTTKLRN